MIPGDKLPLDPLLIGVVCAATVLCLVLVASSKVRLVMHKHDHGEAEPPAVGWYARVSRGRGYLCRLLL
jgi:hypothetical protein